MSNEESFETITSATRELFENPGAVEAYYRRAGAHYDLSNYEAALADVNKAVEYGVEGYKSYSLRMLIKYELNDWSGALEDYPLALNDEDNKYSVSLTAVEIMRKLGKISAWKETLEKLKNLGVEQSDTLFECGKYCEFNGETGSALEYFERALKLAPDDDSIRFDFASLLVKENQKADAINLYLHRIQENPKDKIAWHSFGILIWEIDDTHGTTFLEKITSIHPDDALLRYLYAWNLSHKEHIYLALKEIRNVTRLSPGWAAAWSLSGRIKCYENDYKGALEDYDRASLLEPYEMDHVMRRAEIRIRLCNEMVEEDFKILLKKTGYEGFCYAGRMMLQWNLGNESKALQMIDHMPGEFRDDAEVLKARLQIEYHTGRFKECTATCLRQIEESEDDNIGEIYMALSYLALGNLDIASRAIKEFEVETPANRYLKLGVEAQIYFAQGEFEKAYKLAYEAQWEDMSGGAHYVLGLLAQKKGDNDAAYDHFIEAEKMGHRISRQLLVSKRIGPVSVHEQKIEVDTQAKLGDKQSIRKIIKRILEHELKGKVKKGEKMSGPCKMKLISILKEQHNITLSPSSLRSYSSRLGYTKKSGYK